MPFSIVAQKKRHTGFLSQQEISIQPYRLLENCEEAIIVLNNDFQILYCNDRAIQITAYSIGRILGTDDWNLFSIATGATFEQELRQLMRTGNVAKLSVTHTGLQTSFTVHCVSYPDNTIALFLQQIPDTLQQTQSRELDNYRTLINLVGDWLFETNTEGLYIYVSDQISTTLGYLPQEVIGKSPIDLMSPEYRSQMEPIFRQIAATQTSYARLEGIYITKNGKEVYQESSGTPIYDARGNWSGYRGVQRNITLQKEREASLYDIARKQSRIAETLQASLLNTPSPQILPNVEVVTRYEAASPDALVGGDLFDIFPLMGNKIAFVVGDMAGKGLEAAVRMAEIKFLLRSYLRESTSPEDALARLNRQLFLQRTLEEGRNVLIGLSVAVLDTATGNLEVAVAGMEPPFIIHPGSPPGNVTIETVNTGGLPIGAMPAWHRDLGDSVMRLSPGDLLFLYTDGVVEALPKETSNTVFGPMRLLRSVSDAATVALGSTPPLPIAGICDAVVSAVHQFTGAKRRDDICLLLVQYLPLQPPSSEIEIQSIAIPLQGNANISQELEVALYEREAAVREREIAVREREAALREKERGRVFQRRFLTEVLANVTEGRLRLCHKESDLPELLPRISDPLLLTTPQTLSALRRSTETVAALIGISPEGTQALTVAVGEAAMNCIVHAGGGTATFHGSQETGRLQVCIVDTGEGISEENLHRATLERGYTTAGSLGLGFSLMYSVADQVSLLTGSSGTTIILEKNRNSESLGDPRFKSYDGEVIVQGTA